MSKVQMLRCLVNQRLTAAAEEIFGLFERTIAEYEEELSRSKEENERTQRQLRAALIPQLRLHRADVQQLLVVKEEVPPEQQEWSSSLDQENPESPHIKEEQEDPEPPHIKEEQEDPEPPHIKEEQEDLWTSQEGEQLQGLEETGVKFSFSPVKTEVDEEEAQSSQLHQRQTEQMETEADEEDCGGPEPVRNSDPDRHQAPDTDENTVDSSDTDDSDDWKETRPRWSAGEKLFRCSECEKTFNQRSHLQEHMRIHTAEKPFSCSVYVQQLLVVKEEVPHEQQEWSSSLDQEDPEPPHIKEDQEDIWTSQEGEQLQGLEEADVKFSFTPMKTEVDEEEAQSSQLHQRQTEQMETEADGEDCGGPESVRNSDPDRHQGPDTDEKTVDSSDTDDWGETREPQSGLNSVKPDEVHVSVSRRSAGEKLFSCSECGNTFIYRSQLMTHMRIHTGEKPFSCTVCQKSFNQRSHLQAHMRTHTREKPFSYSVFHQRQTEQMETEADGEDSGGPEPGRNSDPDRHQGPDTDEKTVDSSNTDDWKETREPQSGLNSVKPDEVHVSDSRRSAGEKLFSCSECGNTFNYRSNLTTHMRIHTGEKPFSCSVCKTSFNQLSTLQTHMRTHTGEKPFSCSVCQKSFNQGSTLQAHMRTHTREKPFSSSVCQKSFNVGSTLQEHMRIHKGEKPFSCSVCKKSFNHYSHLKRHMATHTGEKPYSCSVCKNSFIELSTLQRHMRIHTGEKPFSCSVCKKSFNRGSTLQTHMRIHTGEKPYSCLVCKNSFNHRSHLKRHMRTHAAEKP